MSKRSFIMTLVIFIFSMGIIISGGMAEAAQFKWTFQDDVPSGNPWFEIAEQLGEDINAATGGRLELDVHPNGAIVSYGEITSSVRNGVLDIAIMDVAGEIGRFGPKAILLGASGGAAGLNPDEFLAWYYEGGGQKYLEKEYEKLGVVLVGLVGCGPAELFAHTNKQLTSTEDFDGLKFRTMGLWGDILTELGASVITVPGGEIYQSFERGVIDGFEYCGPSINYDMGFQEIAKYIGVPGIHSPLAGRALIANKKSWEKLPEDVKTILKLVTKMTGLSGVYELSWKDAVAMQKFEEYGTEVFEVSPEVQQEIVKLSKKFHEKYAEEDPEYKEIYESQKDFVNKYKHLKENLQIEVSIYDE